MFSHSDLVDITAAKVERLFGCGMVLKEPKSMSLNFIPDVFAVKKGGVTFQFEIKVSRGDFLKDKSKPHRTTPSADVGTYRYYVVPTGLIQPEDPLLTLGDSNWGLIWVSKKGQFSIKRGPDPKDGLFSFSCCDEDVFRCSSNQTDEMEIVYSYYRGLVIRSEEDLFQIKSVSERIQRGATELRNICSRMK